MIISSVHSIRLSEQGTTRAGQGLAEWGKTEALRPVGQEHCKTGKANNTKASQGLGQNKDRQHTTRQTAARGTKCEGWFQGGMLNKEITSGIMCPVGNFNPGIWCPIGKSSPQVQDQPTKQAGILNPLKPTERMKATGNHGRIARTLSCEPMYCSCWGRK